MLKSFDLVPLNINECDFLRLVMTCVEATRGRSTMWCSVNVNDVEKLHVSDVLVST